MRSVTDRRRARDDHGITIVFMALSLVVLLVFTAFAVDFGALYNARRADQSAADASALAAVQDLSSPSALYTQVDTRASNTLQVSPGTLDWSSCPLADPDPVDTPLVVSGTTYNCITLDGAGRVQVKLATRSIEGVFAQFAGNASLDHTAFAIAGLDVAGFGNVLPFGISFGSDASYVCIKNGSGGHSEPPCDGPSEGNFGYLDFTYFGNAAHGTTQRCSGQIGELLPNNIAAGIDHDLSKYSLAAGQIVDHQECGNSERSPNAVKGETGNMPNALGDGIYSGTSFSDGDPARLARTDSLLFNGAGATESIAGFELDDNPLWEFIEPIDEDGDGVVEVPASCSKTIFTEVLANDYDSLPPEPANVRSLIQPKGKAEQMRLLLDRCFTHYRGLNWDGLGAADGNGPLSPLADSTDCPPAGGCQDPVFARNSSTSDPHDLYDIQYTPRFGYVPQLTTNFGDPAANPSIYRIASFRAIFMQRLLGSCNGSGICNLDFEPGAVPVGGNSPPSNGHAEALTTWVFPEGMLPNGLSSEDAPFDVGKNRFVTLVR